MEIIEQVVHRENLARAYKRVVSNRGAPGVDGLTVDDLMSYCRVHWNRVKEEILSGRYLPSPVRKVEIPKPGGNGTRMLGIPTTIDRLIQQAILQVLEPLFEPLFSESSYGFRPKRSALDAVKQARSYAEAGHQVVVDLDLEKFFDRVNHDVLMTRVARVVKDKRVLRLIRRFLQAGIMEGGVASPRTEGTPQGGPLSPLLSNILLTDFDRELERRGHLFCRYADDCNIYVRSFVAGQRVMTSITAFLERRLRLKVNRDKSAVEHPWKRKFLGYTMTQNRKPKLKPDRTSVVKLKNKLRQLFRVARGGSVRRTTADLKPIIRGWVGYFRLSEFRSTFENLDKWMRHRLRAVFWRHWKRPRTRYRELIKRGIDKETAGRQAWSGRGPWHSSGTPEMNRAIPNALFRKLGYLSFLEEYQRLKNAV